MDSNCPDGALLLWLPLCRYHTAMTQDAEDIPYTGELGRKALHIAALAIPGWILMVGKPMALWTFGALLLAVLLADVLRHRVPWIHTTIKTCFGRLMRPKESPELGGRIVLNGATWMIIGAVLSLLVFPGEIAAIAMAIVISGDAAAAVIGRKWGRTHFGSSRKTFEGSLSFVAVGWIIGLCFVVLAGSSINWGILLGIVVLAAVVEALPIPINDNLYAPLITGALLLLSVSVPVVFP